MKYSLFANLLLILLISSCSNNKTNENKNSDNISPGALINKYDSISGESTLITNPVIVINRSENESSLLSFIFSKDSVDVGLNIYLSSRNVICLDRGSEAQILFKNGNRLIIYNRADYSCEGKFVSYFGHSFDGDSTLKTLSDSQISALRIVGDKGMYEASFSEKESTEFKYAALQAFNLINKIQNE